MSTPAGAPPVPDIPPPQTFGVGTIATVLGAGWRTFRSMPGPSCLFATGFALVGLVVLVAAGHFGVSPMALPFVGGFMLVAPPLLTGFFALAGRHATGRRPRLRDAVGAFAQVPGSLWLIALLCAFLFLIWITDAAVLYAMMIGPTEVFRDYSWVLGPHDNVAAFALWGSVMGSVIAFIILAISAFSVPLLYERRANLVQAVHASVRAILRSFPAAIIWGMTIAGVISLSIVVLPVLIVTLPVLAYASFALYRTVFPTD